MGSAINASLLQAWLATVKDIQRRRQTAETTAHMDRSAGSPRQNSSVGEACPYMTLSIRPAVESDIDRLCALARVIWQATYPALISQAQIDFMLADRYATTCIRAQLADPSHAWRLAWFKEEMIGFAHARIEASTCKLDKLYIHPDYQRRGIGGALLADIKTFARNHAAARLGLQVNRGNIAAIAAYQQYGFVMKAARVFDIGGGFIMDDYVMEMPL